MARHSDRAERLYLYELASRKPLAYVDREGVIRFEDGDLRVEAHDLGPEPPHIPRILYADVPVILHLSLGDGVFLSLMPLDRLDPENEEERATGPARRRQLPFRLSEQMLQVDRADLERVAPLVPADLGTQLHCLMAIAKYDRIWVSVGEGRDRDRTGMRDVTWKIEQGDIDLLHMHLATIGANPLVPPEFTRRARDADEAAITLKTLYLVRELAWSGMGLHELTSDDLQAAAEVTAAIERAEKHETEEDQP